MDGVDARYLGLTANQLAKIATDLKAEVLLLRRENAELRDEIEHLLIKRQLIEDVNAKLREQGARLFDKTLELGTENAKLRELVRSVLVLRHDSVFKWLDAATAEVCGMSFTAQARELGIEVD